MSENSHKEFLLIPQTELLLLSASAAPVVERVPVFTDSRGVVHYHERAKPVESTQIVMRATHYRHWLPRSDEQVWEQIYPKDLTDEERATIRNYGKVTLLQFLGAAFVIFVLSCIVTTDNLVCDSVLQFIHIAAETVNPVVKAYFAEPVRLVIAAAIQAIAPAYQFIVEAVSLCI